MFRSLDAVDKHVDTDRALAAPDPYWLARCEGWRVVTPAGRLGTVRRLLYASRSDVPDALMIRVGFLRQHEILVDTRTVEEIIPSEGTLRLNRTPADVDLPTVLKGRIPRAQKTRNDKSAA
jgi:hypothetical protein